MNFLWLSHPSRGQHQAAGAGLPKPAPASSTAQFVVIEGSESCQLDRGTKITSGICHSPAEHRVVGPGAPPFHRRPLQPTTLPSACTPAVLQLLQGVVNFPDPALADNFVAVANGEFVLGCNKFPISGFNQ